MLKPTRAELAQRLHTFDRQHKGSVLRITAVWVIGLVVMWSVAVLAADTPHRWIGGVTLVLGIALIFGGAFHLDRARNRTARNAEILCGSCRKPLLSMDAKLALTTGRCPSCGEPVISDL